MELGQILGLGFGAILLIVIVILAIFKKDYLKYSKLWSPILKTILSVLKAVSNMLPNQAILNSIILVVSTAINAAGHAETLWLDGIIDKANRAEAAQKYIESVLLEADIEMTDSIQAIIQGAISLTCYLMPHYEEKNEEE